MKRFLVFVGILMVFITSVSEAAPIAGYIVNVNVPLDKRYQFYEAVGGATTLDIWVKGDLGKPGYLGYVQNNGTVDAYLHINYAVDTGDTMKKIKIPKDFIFIFDPGNIPFDYLRITSAANVLVDVLVH